MRRNTILMASLLAALAFVAARVDAALVHQWTFNGNVNDSVGTAHGSLNSGASITNGQLVLDGADDFFTSGIFTDNINAKTLVSWASLNVPQPFGPSATAGSVLNVQTPDGNVFDGIVFGERVTNQWMAGSNGFTRTIENNGGAPDTTRNSQVMMAISYAADGAITLYRNNQVYASGAQNGGAPLQPFTAGNVQAQIGHRHGGTGILGGLVNEARVYNTALDLAEISAVFAAGPVAGGGNTPPPSSLLHRWSFNNGTANDSIGTAHGTPSGGASISGGRLSLNGVDGQVLTAPINETITTKTLVSWVSVVNLDQPGGGSALSLQIGNGNGAGGFDGIVYAERQPRQWMAGSNGFSRTVSNNGGAPQNAAEPTEVMMAIVYGADNSITIYRDGALYASAANTSQGTLNTYVANTANVIFGRRHDGAGNPLNGFVNEARIYGTALTAAEINNLFVLGPNVVPEPSSVILGVIGLCSLIALGRRRIRS